MFKKLGITALLSVAFCGFSLIILQYKVTELSLEIPHLEEAYLQKKQQIEKLEFDLRVLKNPRRLMEAQTQDVLGSLVFPKQSQVIALEMTKTPKVHEETPASSKALILPLAKVFP